MDSAGYAQSDGLGALFSINATIATLATAGTFAIDSVLVHFYVDLVFFFRFVGATERKRAEALAAQLSEATKEIADLRSLMTALELKVPSFQIRNASRSSFPFSSYSF